MIKGELQQPVTKLLIKRVDQRDKGIGRKAEGKEGGRKRRI